MNLLNILFLFFQGIPELEQQIKGNMKLMELMRFGGLQFFHALKGC